ncbi:glycosyltransferase family 2 protein [Brevibacillus humidisoli]|uniref:glycosyltransferase family 2 protein n=1 Tax=Brevibacillus humidisoli TaxID=2895522 RepID=UPI001E5299C2|nr:glycosyltransferase family 2 protein [Brevibacillus humidisoli]UFJ42516.1 glycosyltransferase family 2 protein [Brevibacillus humidisoli]
MSEKHHSETFISVIIPTLNHSELLEICISSFSQTAAHEQYELIVVDDGSEQAEKERIRLLSSQYDCTLLELPIRQSYAKAVNMGLRAASGNYILLLNNDVAFEQSDWLRLMLNTAQQAWNIGIVGCRLLYPDGTIQHGGGILYPQRHYDHLHRGRPGDEPAALLTYDVPAVTGALMLIKKEVLDDIGLLSEDYLLSFEDVDFCLRARQSGWRVVYCGQAAAIHDEGSTRGSSREKKPDSWYQEELRSLITFWSRWQHYSSISPLQSWTLLFALDKQLSYPSEQIMTKLISGLREHGCSIHLESVNHPDDLQKLIELQKSVIQGVIFTNSPDICRQIKPHQVDHIPCIPIEPSQWKLRHDAQDLFEWINRACKYVRMPKKS